MTTKTNLKRAALLIALSAAIAVPVLAQPGPGMGMGGGQGMQSAGQGAGQGMGRGGRGMRFNQTNTSGWTLMTAEERTAHQLQMRAVKTYDECKALQTSHRSAMEERSKDKGVALPTPRQNGCDNMKSRGFIK